MLFVVSGKNISHVVYRGKEAWTSVNEVNLEEDVGDGRRNFVNNFLFLILIQLL